MIDFDRLSRFQLEEAGDFLSQRLPFSDKIDLVIQLGSGQTSAELLDEVWHREPLREMPHLPTADSLARHRLEIVWGRIGDYKVLVYAGRYHLYEGFGELPCILPIWAAAFCGARNFLLTNAAGSLNRHLPSGGLMVITDHINNLGISPLVGHQHLLETPFVDMVDVYSPELTMSLTRAASIENVPVFQGIYMANLGPQYETPAELQMAKVMGADAVGQSTVLEAIAARAMGGRVLAVSMIKNFAYGLRRNSPEQAAEVGNTVREQLIAVIRRWLTKEAKHVL
ncbi:MAG: purine-nucleoside phosphorylase [Rhodothermales bacterium]